MDQDATDAAWFQQELEERQRWEQHRQTVRAFRVWIKEEFPDWFLNTNKQEHAND